MARRGLLRSQPPRRPRRRRPGRVRLRRRLHRCLLHARSRGTTEPAADPPAAGPVSAGWPQPPPQQLAPVLPALTVRAGHLPCPARIVRWGSRVPGTRLSPEGRHAPTDHPHCLERRSGDSPAARKVTTSAPSPASRTGLADTRRDIPPPVPPAGGALQAPPGRVDEADDYARQARAVEEELEHLFPVRWVRRRPQLLREQGRWWAELHDQDPLSCGICQLGDAAGRTSSPPPSHSGFHTACRVRYPAWENQPAASAAVTAFSAAAIAASSAWWVRAAAALTSVLILLKASSIGDRSGE